MEGLNLLMENPPIKSFSIQNGCRPEIGSSFLPVVRILGSYLQNIAKTTAHLLYIAFKLLYGFPPAKELYETYWGNKKHRQVVSWSWNSLPEQFLSKFLWLPGQYSDLSSLLVYH